MDCCVISSRWEGGPHTALEALAAGCPLISSRVGMSRDVLPEECLFRSPDEAADLLAVHARTGHLRNLCAEAGERAAVSHSLDVLRDVLSDAYERCGRGAVSIRESICSVGGLVAGRLNLGRMQASPGIGELQRRVCERAAARSGPHGLIEFPAAGNLGQLVDCAAAIAAARRS